jgi:hypothetical protein
MVNESSRESTIVPSAAAQSVTRKPELDEVSRAVEKPNTETQKIYAARDRKLEAAREKRRQRRAHPQFKL